MQMNQPAGFDPSRIGRVLCVGVRGRSPDDPILNRDLDACALAGVGGVILFDVDVPAWAARVALGEDPQTAAVACPRNIASPEQLSRLTAHIKRRLGADVLICIDQEGGATARLNSRCGFEAGPDALAFSTMDTERRREEADRQAMQLANAGIDVNLAPCVDLLLDPNSSVIAAQGRSYGASPETVIENARIVLEAHARHGVGACLKHFPGHGSVSGDSHLGAVDISETHHSVELKPYRSLLTDPGPAPAVMVAHLMHRAHDLNLPASLSPRIINGLLREGLGFDGVVITDSIDMAAIADAYPSGRAAVLALQAGADLVVDGFNLGPGRDRHPAHEMAVALSEALDRGELSTARLQVSIARLHNWREATERTSSPNTDSTS